jgi:hypothetical protein
MLILRARYGSDQAAATAPLFQGRGAGLDLPSRAPPLDPARRHELIIFHD